MAAINGFNFEDEVLKTYIREEIAVIKVKKGVYDAISDLAESGTFLNLIGAAERIPDIKALMLTCNKDVFGENEYNAFAQRLVAQQRHEGGGSKRMNMPGRTRGINILNRVTTQLVEFKKISVMALNGDISTPFFGSSLSVDFRLASADMRFSLPHIKNGLHPGGALPFFLQRYVGHGKSVEILFGGKPILAEEALRLNLINRILPNQDFEENCIREIHQLCQMEERVISATKMLINFSRNELRYYFDLESALLH